MWYPVKVVLLSLAVTFVGLMELNCDQILRSNRSEGWLTTKGYWGPWEWCPEDEYAVGFEIRVEEDQGWWVDDTGLNAIRLNCDNRTRPKERHLQATISSSQATWGSWRGYKPCPDRYIVGFQLRVQPYIKGSADKYASCDLNIICGDKTSVTKINGGGESFDGSEWQKGFRCLPGYAICGIRTEVVEWQGWQDDVAMNHVDMYCCYLDEYLAGFPEPTPRPKRPVK